MQVAKELTGKLVQEMGYKLQSVLSDMMVLVWSDMLVPEWSDMPAPVWSDMLVPEWSDTLVPVWSDMLVPEWSDMLVPVGCDTLVPVWSDTLVLVWSDTLVLMWSDKLGRSVAPDGFGKSAPAWVASGLWHTDLSAVSPPPLVLLVPHLSGGAASAGWVAQPGPPGAAEGCTRTGPLLWADKNAALARVRTGPRLSAVAPPGDSVVVVAAPCAGPARLHTGPPRSAVELHAGMAAPCGGPA